jgi:glyoxylase-like metal-dependent hydrolase (beta-lactamase superfamily II)
MPLKIYEHLLVGPLACNCYIVGDPDTLQAIVIDPGDDPGVILEAVARHGLSLGLTVATHAHFDHIMAAEALRAATGAPFYLHSKDVPLLDWVPASLQLFLGRATGAAPNADSILADGDELKVGNAGLGVIHTPGHSPGSICLVSTGPEAERVLFSGDTLFAQSVGRTDLPGGDMDELLSSVKNRLFLLGDLPVYPGHGPATMLDRERYENPFVGEGSQFWS